MVGYVIYKFKFDLKRLDSASLLTKDKQYHNYSFKSRTDKDNLDSSTIRQILDTYSMKTLIYISKKICKENNTPNESHYRNQQQKLKLTGLKLQLILFEKNC